MRECEAGTFHRDRVESSLVARTKRKDQTRVAVREDRIDEIEHCMRCIPRVDRQTHSHLLIRLIRSFPLQPRS